MCQLDRLRKRRDFLRTQRVGLRTSGLGLVLISAKPLMQNQDHPARVGFTVSKAVGKAHVRNLVKRRLRHMVRECKTQLLKQDLVILAKPKSAFMSFGELSKEFIGLLQKLKSSRLKKEPFHEPGTL